MNFRKAAISLGLLFVGLVLVSPAILFFLWMISLSLKFTCKSGSRLHLICSSGIWKGLRKLASLVP